MNVGWFILLNGAIGVVAFILFCVWCAVLIAKLSDSETERMVELQDDMIAEGDMIYESWFGDPRIGRTLSYMLFIFAWEFMVPEAMVIVYKHFKQSRDSAN